MGCDQGRLSVVTAEFDFFVEGRSPAWQAFLQDESQVRNCPGPFSYLKAVWYTGSMCEMHCAVASHRGAWRTSVILCFIPRTGMFACESWLTGLSSVFFFFLNFYFFCSFNSVHFNWSLALFLTKNLNVKYMWPDMLSSMFTLTHVCTHTHTCAHSQCPSQWFTGLRGMCVFLWLRQNLFCANLSQWRSYFC